MLRQNTSTRLKTILLFVIFALLILFGAIFTVQAQEEAPASDITVFPALFEISAEPGETKKTTLLVVNNSEQPLPVQLETKSLITADKIIDLSKRSQFDASRWVKIDTKNIALKPGETKKVKVEIKVPKNATPGGHYAEIIVKKLVLQNTSQRDKTNTVLIPQVKVPLLITVAGDASEELILEAGDYFPAFIQKFGSLKTKLAIANTGSTHLLPTVTIQVLRSKEIIQEVDYTPGVILPNTKKDFIVNWKPEVPIGTVDLRIKTTYGADSKSLETKPEKAVVFFPIWLIVLLFALSGTIGFLAAKKQNISKAIKVLKEPRK